MKIENIQEFDFDIDKKLFLITRYFSLKFSWYKNIFNHRWVRSISSLRRCDQEDIFWQWREFFVQPILSQPACKGQFRQVMEQPLVEHSLKVREHVSPKFWHVHTLWGKMRLFALCSAHNFWFSCQSEIISLLHRHRQHPFILLRKHFHFHHRFHHHFLDSRLHHGHRDLLYLTFCVVNIYLIFDLFYWVYN